VCKTMKISGLCLVMAGVALLQNALIAGIMIWLAGAIIVFRRD
jgi:hypothetical protein